MPTKPLLDGDPLWYKDAIIYELHVRAFFDSNGDGIGDFAGLTSRKLDYLRTSGVTAIWLLPFYPSPWRDDGYDIADYTDVHPDYGTLADFKTSSDEAHERGLRVITELVLNHTSDQHPWFQRARRAPPGSADARLLRLERHAEQVRGRAHHLQGLRALELDAGTRSPTPTTGTASTRHQPDLNFDNPRGPRGDVRRRSTSGSSMGVDGLRLDAVPYLYEREGTNCENLPETHAFLKELRAHVDAQFPDRMLLAEANQWPEDAVAYFGDGDECHMAFHFPLMPRMFMATAHGGSLPDRRHPASRRPPIPDNCQWALFLRNHDELTLEMVTDEERDYMYRAYAARPAGAHQPRHPPPARAAARQRPPAHRADERPALLAAGHAGHLLRRRDRHGRQHLPRRPQRRAHADAVERRPQRRLLRAPTRSGSTCPSSSTPSTTTRRSTSRRSRPTRTRCCGG